MAAPRVMRADHVRTCGVLGLGARCARLQLQLQDCSLVVTQLTLDKGRNGSHSIVCKVTCCLLSLFLLHSFYLYLNVLGNRRTNVQVKMQ